MWQNTRIVGEESGGLVFESDFRSIAERRELGRRLRIEIPLQSHSVWTPSPGRNHPADIIRMANQGLLPHLIPIRYKRMLRSPLAFFRGAAALMAYDLSTLPRSNIIVQACGDCHLSHFGFFPAPDGSLSCDISSCDETHPAPFEWDVKRLATSLFIATQTAGCRKKDCVKVVLACLSSYHEAMLSFSAMGLSEIRGARNPPSDINTLFRSGKDRSVAKRITGRTRKKTAEYIFPGITRDQGGRWRIADERLLIAHPASDQGYGELLGAFDQYTRSLTAEQQFLLNRYRIADFVIRTVGISGMGTRCGIFLLMSEEDEPLFIQIREARPSVLEPFTRPSPYQTRGERIVQGQRMIQSASDPFLGWTGENSGIQYFCSQYREMNLFTGPLAQDQGSLQGYAGICGWTLARAHARAGDAPLIAGYIGKDDTFDTAIASFAKAYAKQNESDLRDVETAWRSGLLTPEGPAEEGTVWADPSPGKRSGKPGKAGEEVSTDERKEPESP